MINTTIYDKWGMTWYCYWKIWYSRIINLRGFVSLKVEMVLTIRRRSLDTWWKPIKIWREYVREVVRETIVRLEGLIGTKWNQLWAPVVGIKSIETISERCGLGCVKATNRVPLIGNMRQLIGDHKLVMGCNWERTGWHKMHNYQKAREATWSGWCELAICGHFLVIYGHLVKSHE